MLKANSAKTVLAPESLMKQTLWFFSPAAKQNRIHFVRLLFLPVGSIAVILIAIVIFSNRTPHLTVNGRSYKLIVANTSAEQVKGLGYRNSLPQNQGMLFVFNSSSVRCFWMKGMEFPLDIIWLNANKKVVFVAPNLLPATYPHNFCPPSPARFVIELNADQAGAAGISTGSDLRF